MHEVLVNPLGGLHLPRKSVVRLTDRPDMTLDVYRGRKTIQQQQQAVVRYWPKYVHKVLVNCLGLSLPREIVVRLTGPEVIKPFSCSTQLSMEFQMFISVKISRKATFFRLR